MSLLAYLPVTSPHLLLIPLVKHKDPPPPPLLTAPSHKLLLSPYFADPIYPLGFKVAHHR